MISYS